MEKVVIIKKRVYLLRVVRKISLILEVDLVRGIRGKVNQDVDHNPSPRRKSSVTIAKSMVIINTSVRSCKIKRKVIS
jgi:hypothetical protein